jgi:hypothetical protein
VLMIAGPNLDLEIPLEGGGEETQRAVRATYQRRPRG